MYHLLKTAFILVSTALSLLTGQPAVTPPPVPNTHFVYALLHLNINTDSTTPTGLCELYISSFEDRQAKIKIPFVGVDQFSVLNADNNREWKITRNLALTTNLGEDVKPRGAIMVTNGPVSLQLQRSDTGTADAYLALPIMKTSTEFYLMSYQGESVGYAELAIAAPVGACVELYVISNGQISRVWLKDFQMFDIHLEFAAPGVDITGWYVKSSAPIAVYSGHECAQIPVDVRYCDHLVGQIPPVNQWGTTAVVGPIAGRDVNAGYTIRIVSGRDGTVVLPPITTSAVIISRQHHCGCTGTSSLSADIPFSFCTQDCVLDQGQFVEFVVSDTDAAMQLECSHPCLVAQFNHGAKVIGDTAETTSVPDPSMTIIPPIDHYSNQMSFATPNYYENGGTFSYNNYITIVAQAGARDGIMLDGLRVNDQLAVGGAWFSIGDFFCVCVAVTHGFHRLHHDDPAVKFMVFVYGHAQLGNVPTSYSFPAAYEIFGETVGEEQEWEKFIEPLTTTTPAGPTTTTVAPTCNRSPSLADGPNQAFTFLGQVAVGRNPQMCLLQLRRKTANITENLNNLLCRGQICPGVDEGVFVEDIRVDVLEDLVIKLKVFMATTLDTSSRQLGSCIQQILIYLSVWEDADVINTCGELVIEIGERPLSCPRRT